VTERLKIAVVKMTGCAGCQMEFLRLEEEMPFVLEIVDIRYFVMAKRENLEGPYDLTFVEGSVSTPRELEELKELRSRSKTLVAFGDCACHGCVPSILNWMPPDVAANMVYPNFEAIHSKKESYRKICPLGEFVTVDIYQRGCPPHKNTILEVLRSATLGIAPFLRRHPVCVECKLRENVCILTFEKRPCMGPVTAAGCGAICPTVNRECEGCYGPMSDANAQSLAQKFSEIGLPKDHVTRKFRKYAGITSAFAKEAENR
jgi:coenzyme F420-reducing hydrogenase gamma subunit